MMNPYENKPTRAFAAASVRTGEDAAPLNNDA
jgi:hypothetical protein